MARTIRNQKLDTRTARLRLAARPEPYFESITPGCALGYRAGAGAWIARYYDPETQKKHYHAIGAADDIMDADGKVALSFAQAQEIAREWFKQIARHLNGEVIADRGRYTVAAALEDYFIASERRGVKGVMKARSAARLHITPALGASRIENLTSNRLREWFSKLSSEPKGLRYRQGLVKQKKGKTDSPDHLRARKASANRVLTILKAALNHAYHEGAVSSDQAWRRVKPNREVDVAVIHYLEMGQVLRLVNACEESFRDIVRGALVTGARYGELTRMQVRDFNRDALSITVRESKAAKPRHIALNNEGLKLFIELTAKKSASDLIFVRQDGEAWGPSHQQRPLAQACERARIEPPATFHILRHTYASTLAMKGVPMGVIAAQLGHSDTRMTEKHYAHLAPNYVAETIRASMPSFGIIDNSNVTSFLSRGVKNH